MDMNNKPSLFQVLGSVVAAAFGVQSSANRERDFAGGGSATRYIIAGIIFTVIFIMAIIGVVRLVLA